MSSTILHMQSRVAPVLEGPEPGIAITIASMIGEMMLACIFDLLSDRPFTSHHLVPVMADSDGESKLC